MRSTIKSSIIRYILQRNPSSSRRRTPPCSRAGARSLFLTSHSGVTTRRNWWPRFAHRYYDAVTVGIDFTARDLQERLRAQGHPWELCKGFDGSAVVGRFIPKEALGRDIQDLHFHLDINGTTVQRGHTADMLHKVDELIAYISRFFTLKMGDLLYTGTPAGVGPVHINDHLTGYLEDEKVLEFNVT